MNPSIPTDIGKALQHWTCYLCDVKRSHILNEGSIKYAISEYLEVAKSTRPDNSKSIGPLIQIYEFEHTHPIYESRSIDLMLKYKNADEPHVAYFEFKYARSRNISKQETERYIDDLFRLASLSKYNESEEAYFLLLGPKSHIENLLGSKLNNVGRIEHPNSKPNNMTYRMNVRKMLSVEKDTCVFSPIDLDAHDDIRHIDRFKDNYSVRKELCNFTLSDNDKIESQLIFCNMDSMGYDDIIVTIWKIKVIQNGKYNNPNSLLSE